MQADRKRAAKIQGQSITPASPPEQAPLVAITKTEPKKRKRDPRPDDDEIDAVFNTTFGKKIKKGALVLDDVGTGKEIVLGSERGKDRDLHHVLGAIRAAPKDDKGRGKQKHTL